MTTAKKIQQAILDINNGFPTQYVRVSGKTIRVADHGANPDRTDWDLVSLVIENEGQSFREDRGRGRTQWERSNEWYINSEGDFSEQFDSIESFLNHFDIED
jgi:hypothetical protein